MWVQTFQGHDVAGWRCWLIGGGQRCGLEAFDGSLERIAKQPFTGIVRDVSTSDNCVEIRLHSHNKFGMLLEIGENR